MAKKKHAANHKKRKNKKPYSREKLMSYLLKVDGQLKEYEQSKFLNPEKKDPVNNTKQTVYKPVELSHTSDQELEDLGQKLDTL